MSAKRALIVDDSRSARSFLARILEKYDIAVDTAETAELAIEYLAKTRPDVIFMDHMMPGMDGFQAVQLIKNNPATATIPIMMYTSQEGELYLGQARALGALGVLPKQIKPAEVSTVLHQLRLVPDRRQGSQSSFVPANAAAIEVTKAQAPPRPPLAPATPAALATEATTDNAAPAASGAAGTGTANASVAVAAASIGELRQQFETLLRTELRELRGSFSASLDRQSERLLAAVRAAVIELNPPAPPPPPPEPRAQPRALWVATAIASAAAAAFALLWWREAQQTRRLMADLAQSAPATRAAVAPDAAADPRRPAEIGRGGGSAETTPAVAAAASAAPAWPELTTMSVPYGEVPLAAERLEQLRTLLRDVAARSFRGRIIVTSFPGRFCLSGSAAEGFGPAAPDTPFARCDLVGNPLADSLTMAQREPLTLVNLIGTIRRESAGAIEVELVSGGEAQRAVPYPVEGPQLTAGEWNRAAILNNRIEIRLRPAS